MTCKLNLLGPQITPSHPYKKLEQHLNNEASLFPPQKKASLLLLNPDALQVRSLLYSFLLLHRKGILQCSSKVRIWAAQLHMKVHQTAKVLIFTLIFCTTSLFFQHFVLLLWMQR